MNPTAPPDRNTWRTLLAPALEVIDSLETTGYGRLDFRLGGGTVLMFQFDHRVSKDIDIFTHDAQALSWLTPRLNGTAEALTANYEEDANALKLTLPQGDIDFIVAAPVIPNAPCGSVAFAGREIATDATSEILAKKLAYRADSFTVRDALDMLVALDLDRPAALEALKATKHKRPALMARLGRLGQQPPRDLARDLLLTAVGQRHAKDLVARLAAEISSVDGIVRPKPAITRPAPRDDGRGM